MASSFHREALPPAPILLPHPPLSGSHHHQLNSKHCHFLLACVLSPHSQCGLIWGHLLPAGGAPDGEPPSPGMGWKWLQLRPQYSPANITCRHWLEPELPCTDGRFSCSPMLWPAQLPRAAGFLSEGVLSLGCPFGCPRSHLGQETGLQQGLTT